MQPSSDHGSSYTLRSLLNEVARLRIVTFLKRASSFNRNLRVERPLELLYTEYNLLLTNTLVNDDYFEFSIHILLKSDIVLVKSLLCCPSF